MPFTLSSSVHSFDPRPNDRFQASCIRYFIPQSCITPSTSHLASDDSDAITFILAHGTGFHKEQLGPMLEDLFELLIGARGSVKVKDAWVIDAPNHGDSAMLNEKVLPPNEGYNELFAWENYGRSINLLLNNAGSGLPVDFRKRNLVGIGHSMGATALILSTTHNPCPNLLHLHLCEPMILPPGPAPRTVSDSLYSAALKRRDIWTSRGEAYETLKARKASFGRWDDRVLRVFVTDGLRSLPTAICSDSNSGVTLKCPKEQEAATYKDHAGIIHAYHLLQTLVRRLPVHIIYGEVDDLIPGDIRYNVTNVATGGVGKLASLQTVKGSGHLVVQTHPTALAKALYASLLHPVNRGSDGIKIMPMLINGIPVEQAGTTARL